MHYGSLAVAKSTGATSELYRLAQILSLVGNTAALLADVFGIIDKLTYILQVDITLTAGQCAHLVWFTTH